MPFLQFPGGFPEDAGDGTGQIVVHVRIHAQQALDAEGLHILRLPRVGSGRNHAAGILFVFPQNGVQFLLREPQNTAGRLLRQIAQALHGNPRKALKCVQLPIQKRHSAGAQPLIFKRGIVGGQPHRAQRHAGGKL
ncbi:hypothetical protein SDC9_130028 [bioreactor metagenome]|uniref:Uncharacterized protein n=1 Tax=bioreactor metagenome TaxID=1076179 RepID=A0A645D0L4_9ZZZZ